MRLQFPHLLILTLIGSAAAAGVTAQTTVVPIWPNGAPGSETWTQKESTFNRGDIVTVRNVVKPTMTVYPADPATASGAAVIVAPGGAFRFLSWNMEGTQVAEWLQRRGVTGIALKYRLSDTGTDEEFAASRAAGRGSGATAGGGRAGGPGSTIDIQAMAAADGRQAIAVVRKHAAEWHVDPHKIGLMGFSAGGYVAVMAALEHDEASRPDFAGAIYTCCVRTPIATVHSDAGPLFIASAADDPISVTAGPALFTAWTAVHKPVEIHIYAQGGHGFGMTKQGLPSDGWIDQFGEWLRAQKLMK
jgi:acetyl esterase/lipase